MKPVLEMSMAEMEYLIHSHEFAAESERVRALACFIELRKIVEFIEERIMATPALPCDCHYCEEIRNRKPKRVPSVKPTKEKEAPIHFSLD
jgi:hypothetical protein